MSVYADTVAGRAYAKLDRLDLNSVSSRDEQLKVLATLRRHSGQDVFKSSSVSDTPRARAGELADRLDRRIQQMDKYCEWTQARSES